MRIVTSWGPKGWDLYGKNFIESTRLWDPGISLTVYVDGMDPGAVSGPRPVTVKRLEEVEGFTAFRTANADKNGETPEGYNYRLDALKFCAKVFALHDAALDPEPFVWLDGDVITTKPLTLEWLQGMCRGQVTHLGRKGINYSETGFIYFAGNEARTLIADMYDLYMTGEIFNYSEWTDAFIFERVLQMHKLHGLEAVNLVDPDYVGLDAFENSPLKEVFTHLKGARKNKVVAGLKTRYDQLLALVQHYMPQVILETGTWNGDRAVQMAQVALGKWDHVVYHGYDLFEDASAESDAKEHNIKKHHSLEEVKGKLQAFADAMRAKGKHFEFHLTKGDTKDTLKEVPVSDFAWLDGGHSDATIAHDWEMCKPIPVVVFDDYYTADAEGKIPEFRGVEKVFAAIPRAKKLYVSKDAVVGGGVVNIAAVGDGLPDLPDAGMGAVPIKVTAQDCMPKDHIVGNVQENLTLLRKWVGKARPHDRSLVIVSAGPSIHRMKDKIIKMWKEGADIAVVKHSLPTVVGWGVDPEYLILLDPRPVDGISTHGVRRSDLLEDIPPSTKVLVASMSDPSVTRHILGRTKNVWGWHAMTQALLKSEVFPVDSLLINGGTCAAWRMVSVGQALGYREYHLFGFDFCYPEGQIDKAAKDEQGRPKYMQVTVGKGGPRFWSTGELIAASQDAQYFFENAKMMGIRIYCHGEGMGPAIWRAILGGKQQELPTLKEIFK